MTDTEQLYINELTAALIKTTKKELGVSLYKAMEIVYNSDTLRKLEQTQTGLFQYGTLCVCQLILTELRTGICPVLY